MYKSCQSADKTTTNKQTKKLICSVVLQCLSFTEPHLHVISGGLRQLFAEPQRVVGSTVSTSGFTAISTPEGVISVEYGSPRTNCWYISLTEVVNTNKVWYQIVSRRVFDICAGTDIDICNIHKWHCKNY